MTRLITLLMIFVVMTVGTVIADEPKSSVTRGQTDSGYIRLRSTTNDSGVTTTRGTVNGKRVRFTTRETPAPKPAPNAPCVGRKTTSGPCPP
jgi:hypothetical protein